MPKEQKKTRGHRPENIERNQAIIALWICGFSQWGVSRITRVDRWNIQKYIKKYYDKYAPVVMGKICDFIIKQGTSKKPTKKGGK